MEQAAGRAWGEGQGGGFCGRSLVGRGHMTTSATNDHDIPASCKQKFVIHQKKRQIYRLALPASSQVAVLLRPPRAGARTSLLPLQKERGRRERLRLAWNISPHPAGTLSLLAGTPPRPHLSVRVRQCVRECVRERSCVAGSASVHSFLWTR